MEYRAYKLSMGGDGDQHLKGDSKGERIKFFYPGVSSPSSHEGPCNIEYKSFNQHIGGAQPHIEHTMDEPQHICDQAPSPPQTSMVPSGMRGGDQNLKEDTIEEQSKLFSPGLSLSSSHVGPCSIEHRDFNPSIGGDQHPIENTRAEGNTFFDPKLSPLSPPFPPVGLSSTGHHCFSQPLSRALALMENTMGGPHQFDKTAKDAPQVYDSRPAAMRARFIEKPIGGPQNDIKQKLRGIQKIFRTTKVEDHQLFDPKPSSLRPPEGLSGMEKFSFNKSMGGCQHLMQNIMGATQQGDENTKGGSQKFEGPRPSGLGVNLQDSMGRATIEPMGGSQNIMQKTIGESPNYHEKTNGAPRKFEGPGPSGLGQRSFNQSINRPQHLIKKTMGASLQGKFMGGSQNLMLKTMGERPKFQDKTKVEPQEIYALLPSKFPEMRKGEPQKVHDPLTPTKGMIFRRHFGCSVCSATSSKCNPEVPTVVEQSFYDVKYPNTARSTYSDGSHYDTSYPSSEEASDSPTSRTKGTEKREDAHKNLREDMLHILMLVRRELRGEVTVGQDDYLEQEMARYKAVLIKNKEKKLKKIMRSGDPKAERRFFLENMERDLLSLLK